MKKALIALNATALLMSSLFQAGAMAEDISSSLSVSGNVYQGPTGSCAVVLDKTTVNLTSSAATMVNQNQPMNGEGEPVKITLTGRDDCYHALTDHKLAFKLTGTADSADGTVLANSNTSSDAAQGIGIGLYDMHKNTPLRINQDTIAAEAMGTMIALNLVKLNGQEVTSGTVQGALTVQVERL